MLFALMINAILNPDAITCAWDLIERLHYHIEKIMKKYHKMESCTASLLGIYFSRWWAPIGHSHVKLPNFHQMIHPRADLWIMIKSPPTLASHFATSAN